MTKRMIEIRRRAGYMARGKYGDRPIAWSIELWCSRRNGVRYSYWEHA